MVKSSVISADGVNNLNQQMNQSAHWQTLKMKTIENIYQVLLNEKNGRSDAQNDR